MRRLTKLAIFSVLVMPVLAFANNSAVQLAGTWKVEGFPDPGVPVTPFVNISSVSADGIITNVDPSFGTGVGEVTKIPGNQFEIKFYHLVPDGTMLEVAATISDHDGDSYTAPFVTTFMDMNGNVLFSFTGTVYATRLGQ